MSKSNTKSKQSQAAPVIIAPAYEIRQRIPTLSERVEDEIRHEYGELGENIPALLSAILREMVMKRLGG